MSVVDEKKFVLWVLSSVCCSRYHTFMYLYKCSPATLSAIHCKKCEPLALKRTCYSFRRKCAAHSSDCCSPFRPSSCSSLCSRNGHQCACGAWHRVHDDTGSMHGVLGGMNDFMRGMHDTMGVVHDMMSWLVCMKSWVVYMTPCVV